MKTEVIGYFQEVFAYWGKLIFQWQIEWMTAPGNQGEILDWNVKYPNTADINTVDLKELSCVGLYWEILIKNMYSEFLFFFSDFQNQLSSVYKCSSMEPIAHLKLFSSFGVLNINLWKAQCAVPELISALSSQWQIMTSVTPVQLFFLQQISSAGSVGTLVSKSVVHGQEWTETLFFLFLGTAVGLKGWKQRETSNSCCHL